MLAITPLYLIGMSHWESMFFFICFFKYLYFFKVKSQDFRVIVFYVIVFS